MAGGAEIGALRVRMAMNAGEFASGSRRAQSNFDKLARSATRASVAIGAAFSMNLPINLISKATSAYMMQAEAVRLVEATLRTTGEAAGFSSKRLQEMAAQLQDVSTFGDEQILRDVTNNLLTFGNVVGPVFERAQKASLNLSTVLQQDLKSSAIQLGKALNNPLEGISALSRVGIKFSEDQKQVIKQMLASNDVMGAQGVILSEVEKFYGDAAAAAAKGSGVFKQAANAIGDAWEFIGKSLSPETEAAGRFTLDMAKAFQTVNPEIVRFGVAALGTTAAVATLVAGLNLAAFAIGAVGAPVVLAIAAIGALGAAVITQWKNIKKAATAIGGAFSFIYQSAKEWLVDLFEPVINRFRSYFERIGRLFNRVREWLGLDKIATAINDGLGFAVETAKSSVKSLQDVIFVSADKMEAAAPEYGPKMVKPILTAADLAKVKGREIDDATRQIERAQQRLVADGVRLTEDMKSPYQVMQDDLEALDAALRANAITAQQHQTALQRSALISQNAYATMASGIVGDLQSAFGSSKEIAIAQALINTYQSVTNAMANIPAPFNFAAAAAALAAGMAQVANIRSTKKGSTTPRTGGAAGGGAGAGGGGLAAGGAPGGGDRTITVEGLSPDSILSGMSARRLVDMLNEAGRDGVRIAYA